MTISVRRARQTDADDVARLTAQLGYEADSGRVAARLGRILSRQEHQFLIAESAGRTVGWLHASVATYVETDPFVVIGGLVVDRDRRRQGIGRLLMQHAEAWAAAQGCPVVRVWSSTPRAAAHQFYESLGYAIVKTQHSFVKVLSDEANADLARFTPQIRE